MLNKKPALAPSEWKRRRLRLDLALIVIFIWLTWMFFFGDDSILFQQASIALIGAGTALIGQYIFGSVWDDKNYMETLKSLNEKDPTIPTEVE